MEHYAFSFGRLLWQLFNLFVLIAVFAFLIWRVVRMIRRAVCSSNNAAKQKPSAQPLRDAIREHRIRCQMTQEFVAESLGVSRQAVSKWESGASEPSTANLMALAKLFGIPAQELLMRGKEQVK